MNTKQFEKEITSIANGLERYRQRIVKLRADSMLMNSNLLTIFFRRAASDTADAIDNLNKSNHLINKQHEQ